MSVLVKDWEKNEIILYTKGADSILFEKMSPSEYNYKFYFIRTFAIYRKKHIDLKTTSKHLSEYGKIGLRTLVLGKRIIEDSEFESWNQKYKVSLLTLEK